MMYEPDSDDVETDYQQEYYTIPARTHQKFLTDPYVEPSQSVPVLMASTIVPIMYQGSFLGITGVDVTLADIDRIADETRCIMGRGSSSS
jgi:hypothetical protein